MSDRVKQEAQKILKILSKVGFEDCYLLTKDGSSVNTEEIANDVVVDFDVDGKFSRITGAKQVMPAAKSNLTKRWFQFLKRT